jgi:uncharacterized protein (TIGR02597 family)
MRICLSLLGLAVSAVVPTSLRAQGTVDSETFGVLRVDLVPGADNIVGVPLRQAAEFVGEVATVDVTGDAGVIGLSPATGAGVNAWQGTAYLRVLDGAHLGEYYAITANDGSSVTVDTRGDSLAGLQSGDAAQVVRYWTLAELFPPATQSALVVSTGTFPFQRQSEVLMPNLDGVGINRAPNRKFFIYNGQWRQDTTGTPVADSVILEPDSFLIVRQKANAGTRTLLLAGTVETGPLSSFLYTRAAGQQDNLLSLERPVPVRLADLDLGGAFTASLGTFPFQRRDELLVWAELPAGINQAPKHKFFFYNSQWREDSSGVPVSDNFEILPGMAFIVRKYAVASGTTAVWTNETGL